MSQKLLIPGIIKIKMLANDQTELTTIHGFKSIHYSRLDEIIINDDNSFTVTYDV